MFLLFLAFAILVLLYFLNKFKQARLVRYFKDYSVLVGGARGTGKDMLFNYVIYKRKRSYIGNVRYAQFPSTTDTSVKPKDKKHIIFEPLIQWSVGGNTNRNFIEDRLRPYTYPYNDDIDYYISDVGVYFPAQEVNDLNKRYPSATVFQALLRHLGNANLHANTQAFNRPWDKLREQFEIYILCRRCKVFFGRFVHQKLTVYDNYDTALSKARPLRKGLGRTARLEYRKFTSKYGLVKDISVWYPLRKKYDTRVFKNLLKGV